MPKQFKKARQINNLKVIEAAEKLGISQPTLSAWEGERKSPSIENLENMAELYGVTTDFLLGKTDELEPNRTAPIDAATLPIMHDKPVWSSEYGWLLVNAIDKVLVGLNGISVPFSDSRELYSLPQLFSEASLPEGRPLNLSELKEADSVWVEPISLDSELRRELCGWYHHRDRYFENEYGNRFYLDTYNSKWLAFNKEVRPLD